jgi:hypothetical protein
MISKTAEEVLEDAIKSKKETYLRRLSGERDEDYIEYKRNRAIVRKLSRESNRETGNSLLKDWSMTRREHRDSVSKCSETKEMI